MPLQDQKSDILKRVDKRMSQQQLETACGKINSKHTVMRESIRTPMAHRDLCFLRQKRNKKHGMHEPSIHEQDLPVFAKLMGNVSKRRNILNASIQNKCIDMEKVHFFVDESRHPSRAELFGEFGDLQEHQIRGYFSFVQHY